MEDVGIFYGHLVYSTAIWSILRPFGIFYCYLEYFSLFWYVVPRKIWQPCSQGILKKSGSFLNHSFLGKSFPYFEFQQGRGLQLPKKILSRAYMKAYKPKPRFLQQNSTSETLQSMT
jgi:hypothetical protein